MVLKLCGGKRNIIAHVACKRTTYDNDLLIREETLIKQEDLFACKEPLVLEEAAFHKALAKEQELHANLKKVVKPRGGGFLPIHTSAWDSIPDEVLIPEEAMAFLSHESINPQPRNENQRTEGMGNGTMGITSS